MFLSGMNLAWINFANDVGDSPLYTIRVGRVNSLKENTLIAIASERYTLKRRTGNTIPTNAVLTIKSVGKGWVHLAVFTPDAGTNLIKRCDFSDKQLPGHPWRMTRIMK